jgi:hypothetical protein
MNSRSSRSHRSFPGGAYGAGLSSSYGSGLGTTSSAGYSSFSSGYSPSYTSYSGYLTGASRPGYSTAPSLSSPGYNNTGGKYSGGGAYTATSLLPPTATSSSSSYMSKRYTGAKTDSDLLLTNGLGSAGGNPSSWRSKSTDAAALTTNGYRERSLSRDPSTASYNYDPSGDGYAASASRASAARDHYSHHLGRAERSPSFVSSRECRAGSFSGGADSGITDGSLLMSPPPRVKKPVTSTDYLYRSTPPLAPAYDSASRFSNATASLYRPSLSRSNSFHDLREGLAGLSSPTTPKAR